MRTTESAHDALLGASRAFAKAAGRCLKEKTPEGNEQAVKLLEASVMAFKFVARIAHEKSDGSR
ncbi:hypothetical protein WME75_14005 [Sorangium sp. So ce1014]|uniref:hypothetical protein n=1 Tax=Sorangium sp. So ce1014 TaxID=3133326 RepID=UPI003F646BEB